MNSVVSGGRWLSCITKQLAMVAVIWLICPVPAAAAYVEFLYINANEGTASGGHAALKFGEEVFHFQHVEPGLLKLFREPFPLFRFTYGYRENRLIQGHRIELDEDSYRFLRDAFNRQRLIQRQQFGLLNNLSEDIALLDALRPASLANGIQPEASLELKGLGYFVDRYQFGVPLISSVQSQLLKQLKAAIARRYGEHHLSRKRQETWAQLQALKPTIRDRMPNIDAAHFEAQGYSFSQRYQHLMQNLAAIDVLQTGLAPRGETLLTVDWPGVALSDETILTLAKFRHRLFGDLLALAQSSRSDWGFPLLVGMARLHALDESINSRRMVVLARPLAFDPSDAQATDAPMPPSLMAYAEKTLGIALRRLADNETPDEMSYGDLEIAANTYLSIRDAMQSRRSAALPIMASIPALSATAVLIDLPQMLENRDDYRQRLIAQREYLADRLQSLYGYHLLQHNCVTEIFGVLADNLKRHSASRDQSSEEQRLSDFIDEQSIDFIPFVAFENLAQDFRPHSSYSLLPYREQQIEYRYQTMTGLLVDLQESNILTSAIYHWHEQDSAFLFFTQDAVWTRPLFGSFNLAAAVGQAVYGMLAWPWDSGKNLQKSLKGIVVSLPELVFFNIRKGSFPELLSVLELETSAEADKKFSELADEAMRAYCPRKYDDEFSWPNLYRRTFRRTRCAISTAT
ncbi:MAG: hypothetical protein ACU836_08650 [Gammaproteobacteria bacterium]